MKDNILLLITGTVLSLFAWCFWRFLGQDGFTVISTIVLLGLFVDNIQLRRKLKNDQHQR
jgi:hypothetical protein